MTILVDFAQYLINEGTNIAITSFVANNAVLIGAGTAVLKLLAKLTPGTKDDKILTMIQNKLFMRPIK
ncbi:MAG TPA: hypothetical protein VMW32_07845 [Bacteroidales bacterium]|nr:hypothetical protein [Bacteroidales bacterium]